MGIGTETADVAQSVFLIRYGRFVVLPLAGLLTIAAFYSGWLSGHFHATGLALKLVAMVLIVVNVAYFQFRSLAVALGIASGPLPGLALAYWLSASGLVSRLPLICLPFAYVLGFVAALTIADRYTRRVAEGRSTEFAAVEAWRCEALAAGSILAMSVLLPCLLALSGAQGLGMQPLAIGAVNGITISIAILVVPMASSFVSGGENFIALTNRNREAWMRVIDRVSAVLTPRWSWSVSGIVVVFAVLGAFGSATFAVSPDFRPVVLRFGAASALAVLISAMLAARSWRRAVAAAIALATCVALCVWGLARTEQTLDAQLMEIVGDLAAVFFASIMLCAIAPGATDEASRTSFDTVLEKGAVTILASIGGAALLVPWFADLGADAFALLLSIVFVAPAAILFQTAVSAVLEALFPRRRSMAERYKLK